MHVWFKFSVFYCFVDKFYHFKIFNSSFQYYNEFSKYSKKYYNRPSNSRYNKNRKKKGLNKTNLVKTTNVNAIQRQRKYNQKNDPNLKKILPTLVTVNELSRINKNALCKKKIIRKKTVKKAWIIFIYLDKLFLYIFFFFK